MRGRFRTPIGMIAAAGIAAAAAACSSDQFGEIKTGNLLPSVSRPDWLSYSGGKEEFSLRPVTATDLVGPDGQCAAPATAATAPVVDGVGDGFPLVAGGIALQMTECDVVLRAGPPEQMEAGTNERGERTLVLTYIRGNRPGVYRFAGGRLYSIERAPGPAPSERKGRAKRARS